MYEHMMNWELIQRDQAGITPKGIESVHIHIGVPTDTMVIITGNRTKEPEYIPNYPHKLIPIYGF